MIMIGTSGFQFDDWRGDVYPEKLRKTDMLAYYEKELGFNVLEVNYTYYTLPSPRTFDGMLRKTSKDFSFVVRSHKDMTHDIWSGERRTELKDTSDVFKKFLYGIKPLVDAGSLGCVLLQFPYYFYPVPAHYDYLLKCKDNLSALDVVVEFRNRRWAGQTTFDFLRKNELGFCIVDEPRLPGLVPLIPEVTSEIAYFRFHGRNPNWFNAEKSERYDYNYTDAELKEFIPMIHDIRNRTKKVYLFFNNCHKGQAAKNAAAMKNFIFDSKLMY